jgi:hypothetical protein
VLPLATTHQIAVLFGVTGTLCLVYPPIALHLFTGTTIVTMALATGTSWVVQPSLRATPAR